MNVSVNVAREASKIRPDMLVKHIPTGSIHLVHKVTRHWVHCTTLLAKAYSTDPNYHQPRLFKRNELEPCPVGFTLTLKQKA